ncbi:MAG TPA: hypothetical protein VJ892_01460, partial [Candidatus Absconditabacterales bacterium]|nr:hypothetical protein [Candidatus Absconditabacterales bacterium]
MKKIIIFILLLTLNFQLVTHGYLFGIKSFDNTINNIQQIEEKYNFNFPIVAFIFDPWSNEVEKTLNNLKEKFGENKIYHISISPNKYSAKEVYEGKFDQQYKEFFELVKDNDLKVIFRTMHEMNGGRYPRSSDPVNFKKAWIHIRELSREIGLDQKNILFDMSVNHRDMPSKGNPSQTANLIKCTPENKFTKIEYKEFVSTGYKTEIIEKKIPIPQSKIEKILNKEIEYNIVGQTIQIEYPIYKTKIEKKQNCFSFEDYYPGDEYIDLMGITFYNRGKAGYNRHWYYPDRILNDKSRNTLKRLKALNKPIFIDEVATTAVRYNGSYNKEKSQEVYRENEDLKNKRLVSLKDFMIKNPEILGMIYFNIDYTYGLNFRMIGEADWAIINLNNDKFYTGTNELYNNQNLNNKLYNLFQT